MTARSWLAAAVAAGTLLGLAKSAPSAPARRPPVARVAPGVLRVGPITVRQAAREVQVPATFAMDGGILEYVACTGYGKLYESLLRAEADAVHLQVALLLAGLVPTRSAGGLRYQGDPSTPQGDAVTLSVRWRRGGREYARPVEELITDRARKAGMRRAPWVFTGSQFRGSEFAAQAEGSLVAVYHDPVALINYKPSSQSPYRGGDKGFEVNRKAVPPIGTRATLIIRAAAAPRASARKVPHKR